MAKRAKIESVLSRETRLQAEADALAAAAREVEKAAEAARAAAEQKRVATPATKAARPKKAKNARFVREQAEKKPETRATPLPERSTKAGGRMMTKNVSHRPKDEPNTGPKEKGRARP